MRSTFDAFKTQQNRVVTLLEKLQQFLAQGDEVGVEISPDLKQKLQVALDSVADDRLKVALVGGFSEGKTSIAAAWLERLDTASMKISHQESSNEVIVYELDDELVLIDTPGLFGFKEQENSQTYDIEKYKDITKKYVSEAHLVLYVMNSTNPIKESHKEDLMWMFRTLDLLPRTVFVLSRFDEVADVEDEEDYEANLEIKRENVKQRLQELIQLTDSELRDLSIVGVSANPFDLGVEHWLENIEQFKAFSHIHTLQQATAEKIQASGGGVALIEDMRNSVIRDVLDKQLPIAIENDLAVANEVNRLQDLSDRVKQQLISANQDIKAAQEYLRNFSSTYFSDLILQAKGCNIMTFEEFFEREIGAEGILITTRLQREVSSQTQAIELSVEKMQISFNNEVNHFNEMITKLGKEGVTHLLKGNYINNTTVLATRDGVSAVAKTVGLDIGKYLKFKPWGAIKFAKGVNGALAALGIALELWDSWDQYKKEQEFKKVIDTIVKNLEKQRKDFFNLVDSEQFKEKFFPSYMDLERDQKELAIDLNQSLQRHQRFAAWREQAEVINAEFRSL